MSKHTEGPWFITVTTGHGTYIEDSDNCRERQTICVVTNERRATDTANANLIAAAPDLLHALEYNQWGQYEKCPECSIEKGELGGDHDDTCYIGNAIKKARGEK